MPPPSHRWIGETIGKIKTAVAAKKERSVDNDSKNISESKFEASLGRGKHELGKS
jgi:hypothetical protein